MEPLPLCAAGVSLAARFVVLVFCAAALQSAAPKPAAAQLQSAAVSAASPFENGETAAEGRSLQSLPAALAGRAPLIRVRGSEMEVVAVERAVKGPRAGASEPDEGEVIARITLPEHPDSPLEDIYSQESIDSPSRYYFERRALILPPYSSKEELVSLLRERLRY